MKVAVRYLAQLRHAAGRSGEEIELDGPRSLQQLLLQLAERHGEPLRRHLFDPAGGLQPSILLFVGEEQVRAEAAVVLKEGDVLTILSPMAGG